MNFIDIADSLYQYSSEKSKNCKHLKELFAQSILQLEEDEIPIIIKNKKKRVETLEDS